MNKEEVVSGVSEWVTWWSEQRRDKLRSELSHTMSVNPFLMPFLFSYHDLKNISELSGLIIASHLMTGHNTGFGKLIDEKILPSVFKTQKLHSRYRRELPPFHHSCFDEIDHLVTDQDGKKQL